MSLPGRLVERLEAVLLGAFPDDALDHLISRVGMKAWIPGLAPLATRVGRLVATCDAQDRVMDLLEAARDLAPGNVALVQVQLLLLAVAGGRDCLREPLAGEVLDVLRRLELDGAALDELTIELPPALREVLPTSRNALVRLDESFRLLRTIAPLADGRVPLAVWLAAMPAHGRDRNVGRNQDCCRIRIRRRTWCGELAPG